MTLSTKSFSLWHNQRLAKAYTSNPLQGTKYLVGFNRLDLLDRDFSLWHNQRSPQK